MKKPAVVRPKPKKKLKFGSPTILDLERHSGIKRSTISRAFCPGYSIKESTRQAVMAAAAEIGYVPSAGARLFRARRTFRWGFILPHLENPDYAHLVECLDAEARRRQTFLIFGLSHYDSQMEPTLIRQWASGEVDGIILGIYSWDANRKLYEQLKRRRFPIVFLHGAPPDYPLVGKDSYGSHRLAMEHLIALGHRRIGYVGYDHPSSREVNAFRAYRDCLSERGIPLDEGLLCFGSHNREGGVSAWRHLSKLRKRPTALLTFNDVLACGAWMAAHADGLSVPRDLSIVGNDNISESEMLNLSTIRYDRALMARMLLDSLELQMRKEPLPKPQQGVPTELLLRASIAAPHKGVAKR